MKNRVIALSLLASVAAAPAPAQTIENGYPVGSLAVAAIERQDWTKAEMLLNESTVSRDNPARLINLARVYVATGRLEMARSALEQAMASDRHTQVETLAGEIVSTRELSRLALERLEARVQTASR